MRAEKVQTAASAADNEAQFEANVGLKRSNNRSGNAPAANQARKFDMIERSDVQRAQAMASEYAHGHWPTNLVHPVDQGEPRLRLQGISGIGRHSLVVINNTSLGISDSAVVQPADNSRSSANGLTITCRKIGDGYVLVSIAGESHWKLLSNELR